MSPLQPALLSCHRTWPSKLYRASNFCTHRYMPCKEAPFTIKDTDTANSYGQTTVSAGRSPAPSRAYRTWVALS